MERTSVEVDTDLLVSARNTLGIESDHEAVEFALRQVIVKARHPGNPLTMFGAFPDLSVPEDRGPR